MASIYQQKFSTKKISKFFKKPEWHNFSVLDKRSPLFPPKYSKNGESTFLLGYISVSKRII